MPFHCPSCDAELSLSADEEADETALVVCDHCETSIVRSEAVFVPPLETIADAPDGSIDLAVDGPLRSSPSIPLHPLPAMDSPHASRRVFVPSPELPASSEHEEGLLVSSPDLRRATVTEMLLLSVLHPTRGLVGFLALGAIVAILHAVGRHVAPASYVGEAVLAFAMFYTVERVAAGKLDGSMPGIAELEELTPAVLLSLAVLTVTYLPLAAATLVGTSVPDGATAAVGEVESVAGVGSQGAGAPGTLLIGVAWMWRLGFLPAALIVAALSRRIGATMNPLLGVRVALRLGSTYGGLVASVGAIHVIRWTLEAALGRIPYAPFVVSPFLGAYVALSIGCLLGLAVLRREGQLGLA
jgi:hypothetical protein